MAMFHKTRVLQDKIAIAPHRHADKHTNLVCRNPHDTNQWNWSSVTPLPIAAVLLTPPVTIFCSSST
jgi:hypothetical protein